MDTLTSDSAKPLTPAGGTLCAVWRDLLALLWFINPEDGRGNIVKLRGHRSNRESIEARLSSLVEAERSQERARDRTHLRILHL